MNGLKNLAGNDASIFLFRFDLRGNGIDFVLNESIAEDMYEDLDKKTKPFVHACCETLLRYKHLTISDTIMDCCVLDSGELEVMLSNGLGRYFIDIEKKNLFQDAFEISEILHEVMNRRSEELKEGKQREPQPMNYPPNLDYIPDALKEMGNTKALKRELLELMDQQPIRPGLKQLRPEDLPKGITTSRGYDHRGHCLEFMDKKLGNLGKIILITMPNTQMKIQADLNLGGGKLGDKDVERRKKKFEEVVVVIHKAFKENFPE